MKNGWLWVLGALALVAIGSGGFLVNQLSGNLNAVQIAQYASIAGFSGSDLITAVAVALAESSGNPKAFGDAGIGQGSFGLWQISSKFHPEYGPDFTILYDPQVNANAAYSIYSSAGNSFSPWTTFKNGMYASNLNAVQSAIGTA